VLIGACAPTETRFRVPQGVTVVKYLSVFLSVVFGVALAGLGQSIQSEPSHLFTQFGLTEQQVAAIDEGRPVAKVLSWGRSTEIYVFGAVYVNAPPDAYLALARDVSRLEKVPGYLGVGVIPENATAGDLKALTLEPGDIKLLATCREGTCGVQLPTAAIQAFHDRVSWSAPDASEQANGVARGMVLQLIDAYRRGGNTALGAYRDRSHPTLIREQFEAMVGRSTVLADSLPELQRYLLNYPDAALRGADSFLYWEKVDFGLKPVIRVNHAIVYDTGNDRGTGVVAIKQLYASHYFNTALDVSACVRDAGRPERRGFYLLTLKSSQQDGLAGVKGAVVRGVVVDKVRASLEKALLSIKRTLEHSAPALQR
jgi:hypothetical protein